MPQVRLNVLDGNPCSAPGSHRSAQDLKIQPLDPQCIRQRLSTQAPVPIAIPDDVRAFLSFSRELTIAISIPIGVE